MINQNLEKLTSEACLRNQEPIAEILGTVFSGYNNCHVLEIGSGTGQHANFFAKSFANIKWTPSDLIENHQQISLWTRENKNVLRPFVFEAGVSDFPKGDFDIIFTANTFHIMSWKNVKTLIKQVGKNLKSNGRMIVYGPFNYFGKYTAPSNEAFDQILKERNSESGIRNFEDVCNNFVKYNFILEFDHQMPANNHLLIFKKL